MGILSEAQIEFIQHLLDQQALRYTPLKEELLDHLCCSVEQSLSDGRPFAEAVQQAFSAFREDEMQKFGTTNHCIT